MVVSAELLLDKGYECMASSGAPVVRDGADRPSVPGSSRFGVRLLLHYSDVTDASSLVTWISWIRPDEVYNLGAQTHVAVSFELPEFTANATGLGTLGC